MKQYMINFMIFFVTVYVTILVIMTVFQRNFLYHPDTNIGAPEQYGLTGFSEQILKTSDDVTIQTWYKPAQPNVPTVVYFHGNALHMGNRAGIYSAFANKGFGVLAVSYRGYGKSEGKPTERGLYKDARRSIKFLTDTQQIPNDKIILYGESLGTGVAVQMATEQNFAALVLQAPYTSVVNRAAEIYWFFPVHFIMNDKFDSIGKIGSVKSPVLIFHGELDATIPIHHGKTILAAAHEPKKGIFFPDVEHNNFDSGVIANDVYEFTKK